MRRWLADKLIGLGVWMLGDVTETPPPILHNRVESDDGAGIPYPPARITPEGARMLLEGMEPESVEEVPKPDGPLEGTREHRMMVALERARTEMG